MNCGVCSESLSGKPVFTAECMHSFHFTCITKPCCPVCHTTWKNNLPFLPSQTPHTTFSFSDDDPLPPVPNPPPLSKVTITAVPERPAVARSESLSEFTIHVSIKAPSLPKNPSLRAPIDVSASMKGPKLALAKQALHFTIDNLGPHDRLSIISFSHEAQRALPLRRMTDEGRSAAKLAVDSFSTSAAATDILVGLTTGNRVLEERRYKNPVSAVILLSDGYDTCRLSSRQLDSSLLPESTHPIHSFGFGPDHDPVILHAAAEKSPGGTFSFVETTTTTAVLRDAFAVYLGGLLSVVAREVTLRVGPASDGAEVKSVSSGGYASGIFNMEGSHEGRVRIGDLYAEEEKEFLVGVLVPNEQKKTDILSVECSYKGASGESVEVGFGLVRIKRPKYVEVEDMAVSAEVDRGRNRICVAEGIEEARRMAERGEMEGARGVVAERRRVVVESVAGVAGDGMCKWLQQEMEEMEKRLVNEGMYRKGGRAFAFAIMSSHAMQRATVKGVAASGGAYMTEMVVGSRGLDDAHGKE